MQPEVVGPVHDTHASAAELLPYPIVRDGLALHP